MGGTDGWRQYQEDAAELFRAMGFTATVEADISGARARHKVDVAARLTIAGVTVLWIVECKHWKSAVRKEQVMTLAQIAQDVGADRAFLLSESGFQSGAIAASRHSNITLSSLGDLSEAATDAISARRLSALLGAKASLERRLRNHLYDDQGRFPSVLAVEMDEVTDLLGACFAVGMAINQALVDEFPVVVSNILDDGPDASFSKSSDLVAHLEAQIGEITLRTNAIDEAAPVQRDSLLATADQLVSEVDELVRLTGLAIDLSNDEGRCAATQGLGLASMRKIGDLAEIGRHRFRHDLRHQHRALMALLVDGVYLALAMPQAHAEGWTNLAARTNDQASALVAAVNAVRNGEAP